jgi:hypothetical protein
MLGTFAFDVCHDVYRAAREAIDSRIPTLNAEATAKYQWRPDRMPRMAEYVCDFARLGERALESGTHFSLSSCGARAPEPSLGESRQAEIDKWEARGRRFARLDETQQANACSTGLRASPSHNSFRASRMAMFRVYYLGGAEYQAARRHLGISELTWADWGEEIRRLAGREFTRAGLFPPSKYFRESSAKAS